jgi:hypothetical protein
LLISEHIAKTGDTYYFVFIGLITYSLYHLLLFVCCAVGHRGGGHGGIAVLLNEKMCQLMKKTVLLTAPHIPAGMTGIRWNPPESTGMAPESTGMAPESTGMNAFLQE